jgi:hemolysin D
MKSAESAKSAEPMRRVVPIRRAQERRREELAFLPAALEIVETPPSPIGRMIALTLVLLFCAALAWAAWGTIDIVAAASGKIVPSGRIKVIQPFETGVVRSIRVQDGQTVRAGDLLIELDPTVNAAERDHMQNDLLTERTNIARLRAALGGEDPVAEFLPPPEADPVLIGTQRQLLLNQVAEHRAKIAALARQQAQKEAEHATTAATIRKLETTIPVVQQRVDIRKTLMDRELGSKLTYFEVLQLLVEQQEELGVQKSRMNEA